MGAVDEQFSGLEGFLQLPEIKPAMDYYGGRAIQKMSPKLRHSIIQGRLFLKLESYIQSVKDGGAAYPELRCTFSKKSYVFDLSYFKEDRMPKLSDDDRADVLVPPDLAIEILSPGQPVGEMKRKFLTAVRGGVGLGWLIDPIHQQILVFSLGIKPAVVKAGEFLSGESTLPGFSLAVDAIFSWSR